VQRRPRGGANAGKALLLAWGHAGVGKTSSLHAAAAKAGLAVEEIALTDHGALAQLNVAARGARRLVVSLEEIGGAQPAVVDGLVAWLNGLAGPAAINPIVATCNDFEMNQRLQALRRNPRVVDAKFAQPTAQEVKKFVRHHAQQTGVRITSEERVEEIARAASRDLRAVTTAMQLLKTKDGTAVPLHGKDDDVGLDHFQGMQNLLELKGMQAKGAVQRHTRLLGADPQALPRVFANYLGMRRRDDDEKLHPSFNRADAAAMRQVAAAAARMSDAAELDDLAWRDSSGVLQGAALAACVGACVARGKQATVWEKGRPACGLSSDMGDFFKSARAAPAAERALRFAELGGDAKKNTKRK